jgi:hypothetical protein
VSTGGGGAVFAPGPFPVHVDQINDSTEFGHLRCIPSMAGRDTSVTAITVPDISAGSSWFITVWTVCTELVSSPCTPLMRRVDRIDCMFHSSNSRLHGHQRDRPANTSSAPQRAARGRCSPAGAPRAAGRRWRGLRGPRHATSNAMTTLADMNHYRRPTTTRRGSRRP